MMLWKKIGRPVRMGFTWKSRIWTSRTQVGCGEWVLLLQEATDSCRGRIMVQWCCNTGPWLESKLGKEKSSSIKGSRHCIIVSVCFVKFCRKFPNCVKTNKLYLPLGESSALEIWQYSFLVVWESVPEVVCAVMVIGFQLIVAKLWINCSPFLITKNWNIIRNIFTVLQPSMITCSNWCPQPLFGLRFSLSHFFFFFFLV